MSQSNGSREGKTGALSEADAPAGRHPGQRSRRGRRGRQSQGPIIFRRGVIMLREYIYLRTTPAVFLLSVLVLIGAAYIVFRRIVRRDYLSRGQLTWLTSSLQLLVSRVMGFPSLYNPPEWASFWQLGAPTAPALQVLGMVVILAGFLAAFGTMAWFGFWRAFGFAAEGLVRAGPYTITRNPQIIGGQPAGHRERPAVAFVVRGVMDRPFRVGLSLDDPHRGRASPGSMGKRIRALLRDDPQVPIRCARTPGAEARIGRGDPGPGLLCSTRHLRLTAEVQLRTRGF